MKVKKIILSSGILLILAFLFVNFGVSAEVGCDGCLDKGACYGYGEELSGQNKYCDISSVFLDKKSNEVDCMNDFECNSGLCASGKCFDLYGAIGENDEERIYIQSQNISFKIDASISIATLNDSYGIGEQILLTDPPSEEIVEEIDVENFEGEFFGENNFEGLEENILSFGMDEEGRIIDESPKQFGYIVKFKKKPILVEKKELEEKAEKNEEFIGENPIISTITGYRFWALRSDDVSGKVESHKNKVKKEHESAKRKIKDKLEKSGSITGNVIADNFEEEIITNEFENVFNGIALDISSEDAEEIKELPEVESVSPDLEVKTTLMDSVPLIGADDVWQLDENGNDCATSGMPCLTGEGVTIAIIDTGVDYTHADLGGDSLTMNEREFEKITDDPLVFSGDFGNVFSSGFYVNNLIKLDENRLLYTSDCKLNLYDFGSETTNILEPFPNSCPILLAMKGDYIAYTASLDDEAYWKIYLYNINTGENIEIRDVSSGNVNDILMLSENHLVYTYWDGSNNADASIYLYELSTGSEIILDQGFVTNAFIEGNTVVWINYGYPVSNKRYGIYNIDSGEKRYIYPPNIGPLLDFKNREIIYSHLIDGDNRWKEFVTYDIDSGEYEIVSINDAVGNSESEIIKSDIGLDAGGYRSTSIMKGSLEDNYQFFTDISLYRKLYMHDNILDRVVLIPIYETLADFDTEDGKVCILSHDAYIYCHDYNADYDYPIPTAPYNNKVIGGYDIIDDDSNPIDEIGHGTHVAATVAGNGVLKGIAPEAKLYSYKVFSPGKSTFGAVIIEAINIAMDPNGDGDFSDKVDIISMSLGAACGIYNEFCGPDDDISETVDNAVDSGVVVVISAGNCGPGGSSASCPKLGDETIGSPGTARKAITVGATHKIDIIAGFSSRGFVRWEDEKGNLKHIVKPDIVAPGVDICAAQWDGAYHGRECIDDEHVAIQGTSMAAPHVSGAVALIKQAHPDWTPGEIKMALRNTAIDLSGEINTQGYGRINVPDSLYLDGKPAVANLEEVVGEVNGLIDIRGTAGGEDFESYSLYYGEGKEPTEWIEIITVTNPVEKGNLFSNFDVNFLNGGINYFKLLVRNNAGEISEDRLPFFVGALKIESVGDNFNYLSGEVDVRGEILISNYDYYKIEYQSVPSGEWQEICYNEDQPDGEILCMVDVSVLENGVYLFRLLLNKGGNLFLGDPVEVIVINELLEGWPQEIDTVFGMTGINVVSDEESNKIIAPSGGESIIYNFELDGSYTTIERLFDGQDFLNLPYFRDPSIYRDDMEDKEYLSLFKASKFKDGRFPGIIDLSGNYYKKWSEDYSGNDLVVIKDKFFSMLDNYDEIKIQGFDIDGNVLPNFPITIFPEEGKNIYLLSDSVVRVEGDSDYIGLIYAVYEDAQPGWSPPRMRNLAFYVNIYSVGGSLISKTKIFEDNSRKIATWRNNIKMDVADLNGEGNQEIVVAFGIVDLDAQEENLYNLHAYQTYSSIIDISGNVLSEPYFVEGFLVTGLATGNFDMGDPNIVLTLSDTFPTTRYGNKIVSFDYIGNLKFDVNMQNYNEMIRSLLIEDIGLDGMFEIIIGYSPRWWKGSPFGLFIYDSNGEIKKEIEIPTQGKVDLIRSFLITDLNEDNKMELFLQSYFISDVGATKTRMYAFDLGQNVVSRPQSKIVNNGAEEISAELEFRIDKNVNGTWMESEIALYRNVVSIPAGGLIKLDAIFNTLGISVPESSGAGQYRVVAKFSDERLVDLNGNPLEASYEFDVV